LEDLHICEGALPSGANGAAITYCLEFEDKKLVVGNDEYESLVYFCPFCGYKAKAIPEKGDVFN